MPNMSRDAAAALPLETRSDDDHHNDDEEDPAAAYHDPGDDDDDEEEPAAYSEPDDDDEEHEHNSNDQEAPKNVKDWVAQLLHNSHRLPVAHSSLDAAASRRDRDRGLPPFLQNNMHGHTSKQPPKLPLGWIECLATPPFAGTSICVCTSICVRT
jgi:hypothetical protein